jgi:hypothetical protein
MSLANYYFEDPRLVLVPIEHLTPAGMSTAFAAWVAERRGWSPARVAFFDAAFALYWRRSAALARRTSTWPSPRIRHVAVVAEPHDVRPYVQLLNTSAWMLYDCDLDPALSHPELAAYLLVLGDRLAIGAQVSQAAVHAAAYWFERDEAEAAAFAAAARRSARPDAAALVALADALAWLRRLRHETLRPPAASTPHRSIPATGLLVPRALEAEPPALVTCWGEVAHRALAAFHAAWQAPDRQAVSALGDWLASTAPPLLVTGRGGAVLWDPAVPARLGTLVSELKRADGVAVRAIADDLRAVDRHTRAFHGALVDPDGLPPPAPDTEQRGYTYLHRERRLIAYNLHEPGMERMRGPALPYARAMLGARTVHEWAHLAVEAGWVPRVVTAARFTECVNVAAARLEEVVEAAPPARAHPAAADLAALADGGPRGAALVRLLLARMSDYQANLLARRLLDPSERETYVRHNVRMLRAEYPPSRLWRMLVRYLYEYQYLGLSDVADRRTFFMTSTWFAEDFVDTGVLDLDRFDALASAVAALCAGYAVDESRFRGI